MATEGDLDPDVRMRDGSAFSNGTEWECWQAGWCACCKHDDEAKGVYCPIVTAAFLDTNKTPEAWLEDQKFALGPRRFACVEFRLDPER